MKKADPMMQEMSQRFVKRLGNVVGLFLWLEGLVLLMITLVTAVAAQPFLLESLILIGVLMRKQRHF